MHCLCNHSPALICVISLPPLPRSRYLSLPSLIPLVRDFQGPGSKSPFSTFSPGGLIIRIQLYSLELMFLIQSQQSISKHPFLSLPTLLGWGGGRLEKDHLCVFIYVFVCVRMWDPPLTSGFTWQFSIRAVKCHGRALLEKTIQTCVYGTHLRAHTSMHVFLCKCTCSHNSWVFYEKCLYEIQKQRHHDQWQRGQNTVFMFACLMSSCAGGELRH